LAAAVASTGSNKVRDCSSILNFQATASPEPVYDLSDCGLKNVPAGVFTTCKIQRKEALMLQVRFLPMFGMNEPMM